MKEADLFLPKADSICNVVSCEFVIDCSLLQTNVESEIENTLKKIV